MAYRVAMAGNAPRMRRSMRSRPRTTIVSKTGGRLVRHARYRWMLLAESHLTRQVFGDMLRRIAALPLPAG